MCCVTAEWLQITNMIQFERCKCDANFAPNKDINATVKGTGGILIWNPVRSSEPIGQRDEFPIWYEHWKSISGDRGFENPISGAWEYFTCQQFICAMCTLSWMLSSSCGKTLVSCCTQNNTSHLSGGVFLGISVLFQSWSSLRTTFWVPALLCQFWFAGASS